MYFMDFVNGSTVAPSCRYFLGGDNDYLKSYVIDRLAAATGRQIARISSVSEMVPVGLFGREKIYVLSSKSNPKTFQDYTVKLSKSKMGKTYRDAGFTEVSCSTLFPNQVGQFASALMKERGLAPGPARSIAKLAKYDPFTVFNAVQAISYLDKKLTNEELIDYCRNLTTPDTYKIVEYFLEGDYIEFFSHAQSQTNIHEILWSLYGALTKLHKAWVDAAFANTWYQKKLVSQAQRIAPYGFERVIIYVNGLCTAYGESREILLLKLQKLAFFLRGLTTQL